VLIDRDEEALILSKKKDVDKEKSDVNADVIIQELLLENKGGTTDGEKRNAVADATLQDEKLYTSEVDVAVNERLTWKTCVAILTNSLTWLPALSYITSFGFELAVDANLSNILFNIYKSPTFGQTKAGYITSLYGLMNIWTRPSGGIVGDLVYPRFGVPGKKYWMLGVGIVQGAFAIGLGLYIDGALEKKEKPSLAIIIVLMVLLAMFNEAGCGANFALVPHCNPYSNGVMSGLVGSMGNVGGVIFAMVFRFQPAPLGKPFWICGIICMAINACLVVIPVPKT
jgi:NNP family nitrate/nitrite transporter-like MFS transporter